MLFIYFGRIRVLNLIRCSEELMLKLLIHLKNIIVRIILIVNYVKMGKDLPMSYIGLLGYSLIQQTFIEETIRYMY